MSAADRVAILEGIEVFKRNGDDIGVSIVFVVLLSSTCLGVIVWPFLTEMGVIVVLRWGSLKRRC